MGLKRDLRDIVKEHNLSSLVLEENKNTDLNN